MSETIKRIANSNSHQIYLINTCFRTHLGLYTHFQYFMSNLKALKRDKLTSGSNNKLRADGFIPAILYGGNDPNQNISVSKKLSSIINSILFIKSFRNRA